MVIFQVLRALAPLVPRAIRFAPRGSRIALRGIRRAPALIRRAPALARGAARRLRAFPRRARIRRLKGRVGPSFGRRVAGGVISAGAFFGAERLIRKFAGRGAARAGGRIAGAVPPTAGGVIPRQIGTGAGGAGMGVLGRFGKIGLGAAALGAGLFGAEQLAEKFGVRGGAGFFGRRPAAMADAQRATMGLPRRSRRKKLMITKAESRAVRSIKSKIKRMNKVFSSLGFVIKRKGAAVAMPRGSKGVITKAEASKALRR